MEAGPAAREFPQPSGPGTAPGSGGAEPDPREEAFGPHEHRKRLPEPLAAAARRVVEPEPERPDRAWPRGGKAARKARREGPRTPGRSPAPSAAPGAAGASASRAALIGRPSRAR